MPAGSIGVGEQHDLAAAPGALSAELHDLVVVAAIVEHHERRAPTHVEECGVTGGTVGLQVAHHWTQQGEIAREILRMGRRDPSTGEHDLAVLIRDQRHGPVELDGVELTQALADRMADGALATPQQRAVARVSLGVGIELAPGRPTWRTAQRAAVSAAWRSPGSPAWRRGARPSARSRRLPRRARRRSAARQPGSRPATPARRAAPRASAHHGQNEAARRRSWWAQGAAAIEVLAI